MQWEVYRTLLDVRTQAVGDRRLRVPAQHARRDAQLRAVVRAEVFLELVDQAVIVHRGPLPGWHVRYAWLAQM